MAMNATDCLIEERRLFHKNWYCLTLNHAALRYEIKKHYLLVAFVELLDLCRTKPRPHHLSRTWWSQARLDGQALRINGPGIC